MSNEDVYNSAQVSSLKLKSGKDSKLKQKKKNRAKEALEAAEATVAREGSRAPQETDSRTEAQKAFDTVQVNNNKLFSARIANIFDVNGFLFICKCFFAFFSSTFRVFE